MVELITKVHTDGKNYCAAVRERLLDGRRGGCEVIVWFSYLSPHLTSPTTKTLMAKLIFSAHSQPSPANIVRRKPAGVVITLTTLFLMFIHLPKYIRQISGNNEDCNRALSDWWYCPVFTRSKKWPMFYILPWYHGMYHGTTHHGQIFLPTYQGKDLTCPRPNLNMYNLLKFSSIPMNSPGKCCLFSGVLI